MKKEENRPDPYHYFTVVEAFDYKSAEKDHPCLVVTAHEFLPTYTAYPAVESHTNFPVHNLYSSSIFASGYGHHYIFMYVTSPLSIDFGDVILFDSHTNNQYIRRNDILKYRIFCEEFPKGLLEQLLQERNFPI